MQSGDMVGMGVVIPATPEAEAGGSQSEARPGKNTRPYLKNRLNAKGCGSSGRVQHEFKPQYQPKKRQ
jgi:hypothetical protein